MQHFNGKRELAQISSQEYPQWGVEEFAEALELRSRGAVPGVFRLPVWKQAGHINSECFSLLGSSHVSNEVSTRNPWAIIWILV